MKDLVFFEGGFFEKRSVGVTILFIFFSNIFFSCLIILILFNVYLLIFILSSYRTLGYIRTISHRVTYLDLSISFLLPRSYI